MRLESPQIRSFELMCYYVEVKFEGRSYKVRFKSDEEWEEFRNYGTVNGFELSNIPVIYNDTPNYIDVGRWGLIPFWAKDHSIARNTLNAQIETIKEKASFKSYAANRCVVPVSAFYEWKWLDAKGKHKQKFRISTPTDEIFPLAGIWAEDNRGNRSISIVTTEANELMANIHNTKKRMPVVLLDEEMGPWLEGGDFDRFKDRSAVPLVAEAIEPAEPTQQTLF
jgi:putative SOS response-associated peptidase YedK